MCWIQQQQKNFSLIDCIVRWKKIINEVPSDKQYQEHVSQEKISFWNPSLSFFVPFLLLDWATRLICIIEITHWIGSPHASQSILNNRNNFTVYYQIKIQIHTPKCMQVELETRKEVAKYYQLIFESERCNFNWILDKNSLAIQYSPNNSKNLSSRWQLNKVFFFHSKVDIISVCYVN